MSKRMNLNCAILIAICSIAIPIVIFDSCHSPKVVVPAQTIPDDYIHVDSCAKHVINAKAETDIYKDSLDKVVIAFNHYKDSTAKVNKAINEDLFVANYKLIRIREYNRIAGQRNNIKYLRGWINRVLKD